MVIIIVTHCYCLSQALLVTQLNGLLQAPYTATFVPLHITIIVLIVTAFIKHRGNPLWFGIRKNFLDFVLGTCPFLQEYANISVQKRGLDEEAVADEEDGDDEARLESKKSWRTKDKLALIKDDMVDDLIYPYEDLMVPD